jgi:hypothetical protein
MSYLYLPFKTEYHDCLTLKQRRANEEHFEWSAKITKNYFWLDYGECIEIKDKKYICNKEQAILFIKNTTPKWFKRNIIVNK